VANLDPEVLADLRQTVLDNLPDSCQPRKKQVGTTNTTTNSDGMGGFSVAATATQDDFIQTGLNFPCRVTVPRSMSRGAEFESNQVEITEDDMVLVVAVNVDGTRPDFLPEDAVAVTDGETGVTTNYSIKRRLPHSSPFTLHYNCVYLTG
jgi:hypothetical protein